jgi:hypothetical protein
VRRQDDRLAERAQGANELPGVSARGRVEARRRLVEEDEVGVADERDAEIEATLLASRERLHLVVRLLREADEPDHLVDVPRLRVVAGEDAVDLARGQPRPELGLLQDDADPLPERPLCLPGVEAQHPHLACVALAVALEDLHGRRLPGAVRAEQPEDLARADLEVDPADGLDVAVRLAQAADRDGAGHIYPRG